TSADRVGLGRERGRVLELDGGDDVEIGVLKTEYERGSAGAGGGERHDLGATGESAALGAGDGALKAPFRAVVGREIVGVAAGDRRGGEAGKSERRGFRTNLDHLGLGCGVDPGG